MLEKKEVVRTGYNVIAEEYQGRRGIYDNGNSLREFTTFLPKNAKILDVGCGSGIPVTKFLVESGYQVTGIDFSEAMVQLAHKNIPQMSLVKGDMTRLGFRDDSFDGLTAFHSLMHVPRDYHHAVFHSFHHVLKPLGVLLVSIGLREFEAIDKHLDTDMFWSSYGPEQSLRLVMNAGFQIISDEAVALHYWIMARNTKRDHESSLVQNLNV